MQYFWMGVMYNLIRKSKISAKCSLLPGIAEDKAGNHRAHHPIKIHTIRRKMMKRKLVGILSAVLALSLGGVY